MTTKKPPLGIIPKKLWIEQRQIDLGLAIDRHIEAGEKMPVEWIEEWNDICSFLKSK